MATRPGSAGPTIPRSRRCATSGSQAPDTAAQASICAEIQKEALVSVPYIPLGQYLQPTAYRANLDGVPNGFAIFWSVRKT